MVVEDWKLAYTVRLISYKAVDRRRRQSRDRKCHVISGYRKWRHLTGSHLEVALEGRILAYYMRFISYKAVARMSTQSRGRKWCHVTLVTGSDVIWAEVTWNRVWKPENLRTPCLTSYKAVARRKRQSRDRKWRHMTSSDQRWPKVTSFDRKSPGIGCGSRKTCVHRV